MLGKALSRIGKSVPRGIRLFDAAFSLFFLTLLCPLLPFAALGIVLSSRGPIFYRAQRGGAERAGVHTCSSCAPCTCASRKNAGVITAREDSRIFPLGHRLRRLKIDELPQLYNVAQRGYGHCRPPPARSPHRKRVLYPAAQGDAAGSARPDQSGQHLLPDPLRGFAAPGRSEQDVRARRPADQAVPSISLTSGNLPLCDTTCASWRARSAPSWGKNDCRPK